MKSMEELSQENERLRGAMDEMFKNREKWRESHMQLEIKINSLESQLEAAREGLHYLYNNDVRFNTHELRHKAWEIWKSIEPTEHAQAEGR